MSKPRRLLISWLPAILWMVLIFLLSSRPSVHASAIDWQDFFIKKTGHFVEYFILNALLIFGFKNTTALKSPQLILAAFILAVIYAASDELHQTFVPGREGRPRDVVIDTLGISASAYIYHLNRFNWLKLT